MKTYYLPYALEKIVKVLSYIIVCLLDIIHFVLTPFTWMQFKAHLTMISLAGIGYVYLKYFEQNENAVWISVLGLLAVILAVLFVKITRKVLHRIRQSLIKIVYSPLGVCIRIHPVFYRFQNFRRKKSLNATL